MQTLTLLEKDCICLTGNGKEYVVPALVAGKGEMTTCLSTDVNDPTRKMVQLGKGPVSSERDPYLAILFEKAEDLDALISNLQRIQTIVRMRGN